MARCSTLQTASNGPALWGLAVACFSPAVVAPIGGCYRDSGNISQSAVGDPDKIAARHPKCPLNCTPTYIDLGELSAGRRFDATFSLTNPSDAPVLVHGTRTTCACVTVALAEPVIPAGETILGNISLDLTQEDAWGGSLTAEVRGLDVGEKLLFEIIVRGSAPRSARLPK